MNTIFKMTAIAAALAVTGVAHADKAETKGGITIKTEDGRFEAKVGGRIHFDLYTFGDEKLAGADVQNNEAGTEFRRARLTLSGKAYGWEYKFEEDFANAGGGNTANVAVDERDMFIATKLGPGKLTIGQFKPFRSMEELTSSNEITMMERPFSSATGLYTNRQFQQGVNYLFGGENYTVGSALYFLSSEARARNEGIGYSVRGTFAPNVTEGSVMHLGLSYNAEEFSNTLPGGQAITANYSGRRGDAEAIGAITAGEPTSTIGLEFAATFGPAFVQAEYAMMSLGTAAADQDINSYYVMGSYHLTGETKGYKKGTGVFGSVKPANASGAWELTARYDVIENKDSATRPEATSITLGTNYYVNPNVRFMLNYTMGETDVSGVKSDEADQLALRTQFSF